MSSTIRIGLGVLALVVGACASPDGGTKEEKRSYMEQFEQETLEWLLEDNEDNPEVETALEAAIGYALVHKTVTKVPIIGAGGGYALLYDRGADERYYFKVRRIDLGAGWGVREFRLVFLFDDEETMNGFKKTGFRTGAGAEAAAKAGEAGAAGSGAVSGAGYEMYTLTKAGVSVTATVRLIRVKAMDL